MSTQSKPSPIHTVIKVLATFIICGALIAVAVAATYLIYSTQPTAQQESATRKTAALVETIEVSRGTYPPNLEVLGLVEPARDVTLSPRIAGQIIELQPAFVPGGLVKLGEPLLKIDPADFERTLTMRQSELKQVKATLAIEEGQQNVARQEFELLGQDIDKANRGLVLREPQIESIRAQVEAAEAEVEQAELDLERTTVPAPFDAQILSRSVDVGSQVSPGDELARLVGVDEYWIMASVPLRDLRWIELAQNNSVGSLVKIYHTAAWGPNVSRDGRASRLIGTVDQQSRLARVLITVPNPLGRDLPSPTNEEQLTEAEGEGSSTPGTSTSTADLHSTRAHPDRLAREKKTLPPLILGTIVELTIEGKPLENVIRLERAYLRQNDTVWVMSEDNTLDIRTVEVIFSNADHAYITTGLETGDHVVTTSLATVTQGLALRQADSSMQGEEESGETVENQQ